MKRIIYIISICAIGISSCDKIINVTPPYQISIDNAVTNYEGAKSIINGMYASLSRGSSISTNSDFFGGALMVTLSTQAGISRTAGATYYNLSIPSSTMQISTFWQQFYSCVNAANAAITAITKLNDSKYPSIDAKTKLIAEAKTFRAWAYSNILWCFGHFWKDDEFGLLWREEISSFDNVFIDRISVKESYEKLFADLDFGILHLGDYTTSKKLSKQMAQVLKAKLLLNRGWNGDYEGALLIIDDILRSSPVAFTMDSNMGQMYKDAWDSKEVLWARYVEDESGRAYADSWYSQRIITIGDSWTTSNQNNPSSLKSFYPEFNGWIKSDPRYSVTMGWARAISATGILYFCPTKLAREGRASDELMNDKFTTYYFRYPELYLMQSELRARTNRSIEESLQPINQMRSKRSTPLLPQISAPSTREELMNIIFKEYCLELFMENGSEWFAALRFKVNAVPMLYSLKPDVVAVDDNYHCWPIPDSETSTNKFIKPNPGFDK